MPRPTSPSSGSSRPTRSARSARSCLPSPTSSRRRLPHCRSAREVAVIGEAEDRNARYALIAPKGAVVVQHLAARDAFEPDFVAVAERFLGVPYLWGGKTGLGLDCSGLVQIALRSAGISAPRDTDMQESALGAALPLANGSAAADAAATSSSGPAISASCATPTRFSTPTPTTWRLHRSRSPRRWSVSRAKADAADSEKTRLTPRCAVGGLALLRSSDKLPDTRGSSPEQRAADWKLPAAVASDRSCRAATRQCRGRRKTEIVDASQDVGNGARGSLPD